MRDLTEKLEESIGLIHTEERYYKYKSNAFNDCFHPVFEYTYIEQIPDVKTRYGVITFHMDTFKIYEI